VLLVLGGLATVLAAPLVLDTYSVNVLTRSLLLAVAAVTVDLLLGLHRHPADCVKTTDRNGNEQFCCSACCCFEVFLP